MGARVLLAGSAAFALVLAAPVGSARAFDLFGGGGDWFESIEDMFEEWGFEYGDALAEGNAEAAMDPYIVLSRQTAATAATASNVMYSLAGWQIMEWTEKKMSTEYLWRINKNLEENETRAALLAADMVQERQGRHKVAWTPEEAAKQHYDAFVEPAGIDVENHIWLRGHVGEIVAMRTAAGRELAEMLAERAELQQETRQTLKRMVENAQTGTGPNETLMAMNQTMTLIATQLDQQASVDGAFQKMMLAEMAGDQMQERFAFQQRSFDLRDMTTLEPFGWPGYEIGLGGAGNVSDKHDPDLSDPPFEGWGF